MSSYICHQTQTQFETKVLTKYKRTDQVHICGIQPLKNLKWHGLLMAVFDKYHLVHFWLLCHAWVKEFKNGPNKI